MNLEYYSSAALVTSVVVYLLAMTAYAAEWAAARKAPVEESVDRPRAGRCGGSPRGQPVRRRPRPIRAGPRRADLTEARPSSSGWPR